MFVNLMFIILFDFIFAQNIHLNLESQNNIRHSKSRIHFLRSKNHPDELHITAEDNNIFNNVTLTTETIFPTESKIEFKKSYINSSQSFKLADNGTIQLNKNRKVTIGSSLSLHSNNSWQHVDKSMLYMGERALNQIDNKKKNKTSIADKNNFNKIKVDTETDADNDDIPLTRDTFLENDDDDEEEEDDEEGGEEGEGNARKKSSKTSTTEIARSGHVDIVTRFLRIVESQHLLGENCTAGTDLNLGEGVVDRYAQERFRIEADVAVNRANMLTRIWKYADPEVVMSEYLLHASVFSMVEFDDDIFAAGNCYDQYQYKDYWLFCPYAYRLPEGRILVKDLAVEYKYLSNTSEWFYIARKNAKNVIKNYDQFSRGKIIFLR